MIIDGARSDEPDRKLIKLLIKAHELRDKLQNSDGTGIAGVGFNIDQVFL